MTFLVYIETQNFTRIHIEKSTCSTKELSINMTKSLSAVTGGLQSWSFEFQYKLEKSSNSSINRIFIDDMNELWLAKMSSLSY
jgi:hypothetical protein